MKILFLVSSADIGFWLAELTHPYWHFTERGGQVDFASPAGGKIKWDPTSDPYSEGSWEPNDVVSKGFLSDKTLTARLDSTIALQDVRPEDYDAVHVVGGGGAAVDLYPNPQVKRILEHFWSAGKVVGAICHGAIALANNPDRVTGRRATGFSRQEDSEAEKLYGKDFIPNFPQPIMGRRASTLSTWNRGVSVWSSTANSSQAKISNRHPNTQSRSTMCLRAGAQC
jgi:putative intracellular protease/amidase